MVLGYFGKTPVAPDPEVVKIASEQLSLEPTNEEVLILNNADPNKGIDVAKKMLEEENLEISDENIFIAATCKQKGILFLKGESKLGIRLVSEEISNDKVEESSNAEISVDNISFTFMVNGKYHKVKFNGKGDDIAATISESDGKVIEETPIGDITSIKACMPGRIWKIHKNVGDEVKEGEIVIVLEAMKMENDIKSPISGKIMEILVKEEDHVPGEAVLVKIV